MSTYINTNTTAAMASLNLNASSDALSTDIERLSTGLRINSAADDPAGLAIMENMNAQISGLSQATSNSNDAVNMTKTAEGALNQVQNLLVSMRQLAVNASNVGVNDSTDLTADQTQIASAIQSINRISATTQFGNKYLLNGSATAAATTTDGSATASSGAQFAVVSQGVWTTTNAADYTNNLISSVSPTTETYATTDGGGTTPAQLTDATTSFGGALTINGVSYTIGGGSSITALNSSIAASGYSANIDNATGNLVFTSATNGPSAAPTIDLSKLTLSGVNAAATGASAANNVLTIAATNAGAGGDGGTLVTAAGVSANTGITVSGTLNFTDTTAGTSFDHNYAAGTSINQVQTDLNNTFGAGKVVVSVAGGDLLFTQGANAGGDTLTDHGSTLAAYNALLPTDTGAPALAAMTSTLGTNPTMTIAPQGGQSITSQQTQEINGTYYYTFSGGLVLSSSVAPVTTGTTAVTGNLVTTAGSTTTGNDLEFQIGANQGQTASESIQSVAADQLGSGAASYTDADGNTQTVMTGSVADINVTTFKGAQDAIAVLDQAINQVSTMRANMGAFETNVLQSNITSLGVASTNLQASEASVADTDMAATIVDYTKNQILVQAGTSALAYANQMPQSILKLLQ